MPYLPRWPLFLLGTTLMLAVARPAAADPPEFQPDDPIFFDASVPPLPAIDCNEKQDVGYVQGDPYDITVVTVDGKPVEVETANAFYQMQQAAAKDGVGIKVVSGFRTMSEQQYLYNCYINCNCNNCNLAAKPGYSNHQSGHALDLNTGAAGVYNWLAKNGGKYGFTETVPSEDWHWEWWGGGPPANGPCGTPGYAAEYVAQSFPPASQPAVEVEVGACIDAWIDLKNTGDQVWNGDTKLTPTPRDVESPLYADSWLSPTRITAPDGEVAPGGVGHFAFKLCASAPGEVFQTFGLVQEGVTWFADDGGPPDTQLEVRILGVVPAPPPPPPPPPGTTSTSSSGGEESSGGEPTSGAGSQGDGGSGGGEEGGESSGGSTGEEPGGSGPSPGPATGGGSVGVFDESSGCGCRETPAPGGALALLGLLAWRRRRAVR